MSCILGIETSCDETAAAVVDVDLRVRSNVVASQYELHAEYGGVVPEIASRAHLERILPVVRSALREAGLEVGDIAAVAVGIRPGLIGSLLVGASMAKALAWALDRPLHAVDHVAAHLYAGLLRPESDVPGSDATSITPPRRALGLVVSGGHTSLFRLEGACGAALLGRTIDDAIGEAFDKAANMLGLPHPGGPNLERCAEGGDANVLRFGLPRLGNPLDFSFSGLKTKFLYEIRGVPQGRGAQAAFARSLADLDARRRTDLASSFQRAAIAQVIDRLDAAADRETSNDDDAARGLEAVFVGGGVVANRALRAALAEWSARRGLRLVVPEPRYCGDNAAMIAGYAALLRAESSALRAGEDLSIPAEPVSLLARGAMPKRVH
ncbi:MAG: tRNA (adenosine(37)-N6)-threonylcarbamoyltransferase complex transferase subunit TsaD [Planctomycetaceae bacterium]|nr:tRNA (adenosine(37)-N6)-threonylcarbamoyltransferase complex transferase subunit TsaD [Planctomycetaceae bacterium]